MTHLRWMSLLIVAVLPMSAPAQGPKKQRDAHVIFKDGFVIKGKIEEQVRDTVFDSATGHAFPILSGDFYIDDHVRRIRFSPTNVDKVIQLKVGEVKEPMKIERIKTIFQTRAIHATWQATSFSQWTGAGDRTVGFKVPKGSLELTQKIGIFTPHYLFAVTVDYNWDLRYFPSEFGPKKMREMLINVFEEKKDLKALPKAQKFLQIAGFLQEAGWFKEAEIELTNIIKNFPDDKKIAEQMLDKLKKDRANLYVEAIEQASKVGQHQDAIDRLEDYTRLGYPKLVSPKQRGIASDLSADYAKAKLNIEAARKFLKQLPSYTGKKNQPDWTKATEFILDELNYDTVMARDGKPGRLESFLKFAQQYETQRAAGCKPTQTADEVLALAVTSWLQGNQAAETDTKLALKLVRAREFLLEYLKSESESKRSPLLSGFKGYNDLPMDVLAQLVRMIPPPAPHKDINTEVQTLQFQAPNGNGGSYLIQLPPGYHHQRAYPVVLVLNGRQQPDATLAHFSAEAAKYGFILVAPMWSGKATTAPTYRYSRREQDVVLDTLRDLRRRFQVDSDRVFLFGWEEGAKLAFDVGLGHPDLFAGVVPMCGSLTLYQRRFYSSNAQYLPFYVIDGERDGGNPKQMADLFKEWTRSPYVSMYVEYRGRSSEWFGPEVPHVMNWMSRKKRYTPMKEIGRPNLNGGLGEEFHSGRESDNRFYWLSTDSIAPRCLADVTARTPPNYHPATFQATLTVGNKSKTNGKEDIWNQLTVRAAGMKQLTFWVTPDMMTNMKIPLQITLNGQQAGPRRVLQPSVDTLLEELYESGDRQRLFVAKVEIR